MRAFQIVIKDYCYVNYLIAVILDFFFQTAYVLLI